MICGVKPNRQRWSDERLRNGLKQLWREAFGDTEDYITLVFDRIYSQSMTRWREASMYHSPADEADNPQRPVAMLFATGHRFCDNTSVQPLTGVYLSGLATDISYRRQGIMASLLEEFISECKSGACPDFLFLIPADLHLRRYYERFGFRSSGVRVRATVDRYPGYEEEGEWRVIDLSCLTDEDRELIHARISQCENRGREEGCLQISHSRRAIDTALAESAQNHGRVVVRSNSRCRSQCKPGRLNCRGSEMAAARSEFLWADTSTNGWGAKVWNAISPHSLMAMITALCRDALSQENGVLLEQTVLYGASWQAGIMEQLHRAGGCSALDNECYGMILPLTGEMTANPLSIGLMLD